MTPGCAAEVWCVLPCTAVIWGAWSPLLIYSVEQSHQDVTEPPSSRYMNPVACFGVGQVLRLHPLWSADIFYTRNIFKRTILHDGWRTILPVAPGSSGVWEKLMSIVSLHFYIHERFQVSEFSQYVILALEAEELFLQSIVATAASIWNLSEQQRFWPFPCTGNTFIIY